MQMPMLMLPLMEWKESQAAEHVLASLELHPSTSSQQFRLPMMHAHPLVPVVHPRLLVALWLVSPQQQCSVEAHVERVFPLEGRHEAAAHPASQTQPQTYQQAGACLSQRTR